MKRIILAALALVTCATTADADPILTPLLVSAGVTGSLAIGTGVTYASIISFAITTGAPLKPTLFRKRP